MRKLLVLASVIAVTAAVAAAPALATKSAPAGARHIHSATFTNSAFTQNFGSVNCASGELRTGGGVFGSGGRTQSVNSSYPFGTLGWGAFMNNNGSSALSFTVYAVCLS
jgi:hypothetical protein